MFQFFKGECWRFRWWVLIVAAIHLAGLLFVDRMFDPLQQKAGFYQLGAAIYVAVGALLGAYQTGSYARINHWIALLHRPLAPRSILLGVAGAGAAILLAVTLVPLVLLLLNHGMTAGNIVDTRHWLLALAGGLLAVIGFLGGVYAMLAPRRYGWLVLVGVMAQPIANQPAGWWALMVQAAVIATLALLVAIVAKPDLQSPPHGGPGLSATAFAAAMGAYLVLVFPGTFAFQSVLIATGSHPLTATSTPAKGGIIEASRAEDMDLLEAGFAGNTAAEAQDWRKRMRSGKVHELYTARPWLPVRGELTNVMPIQFTDRARGVRWTFSHDDMVFHGIRAADGRAAGIIQTPGGFEAPPLLIGGGRFIAGGSMYVFDPANGTIPRQARLSGGETIVATPAKIGGVLALLGNHALHLYKPGGTSLAVPLPGAVGDLRRLHLVELAQGYIVSFTFGRDGIEGPRVTWQRIVAVDASGASRTIAERQIAPDLPAAVRFASFLVSPALDLLADTVQRAEFGSLPGLERAPIRVPEGIWIAAALASLVAALVAALLARWRRLGIRRGAVWTVATLIFGVPMLVAFWLIRPVAQVRT